MTPQMARLLSDDRAERLDAVEALETSAAPALFALRAALLLDEDAEVRSSAARRLAEPRDPRALPWLREATVDSMPSVRDAAWRSLAALGDPEAAALARRAALEEPVWWVRRTAVRALAALDQHRAIDTLVRVLGDPFWRVRYAAVQALAVLGLYPSSREEIRAGLAAGDHDARAALAYLEELWGTGRAPDQAQVAKAPAPAGLPTALDDGDPAVVTERVRTLPPDAIEPAALVTLLGDAHAPLRKAASRRLLDAGDLDALQLALTWLEEPRVPHAAEGVQEMLVRAGGLALPLAARVLKAPRGPGAIAWAANVAVDESDFELIDQLVPLAQDPDARIRRAALAALARTEQADDVLEAALSDKDDEIRVIAAVALAEHRTAAVLRLPVAGQPLAARRVIVAAAERAGDLDTLQACAEDEDAWTRAVAISALLRAGALTEDARRAAASNPDPWLRAAALEPAGAVEASLSDPDTQVRRTALALVRARRREIGPDAVKRAARGAAASPDPWARATSAELLALDDSDDTLSVLLQLSRDTSPMVRSAAAAALKGWPELSRHLRALLASPRTPEGARIAGFTWLLCQAGEDELALLRASLNDSSQPPAVVAHLEALTLIFSDELLARAPEILARRPHAGRRRGAPSPGIEPPPEPRLRPLGTTGVHVSPLVISGVHELPPGALVEAFEAGVRTFFWEPRYAALTRFLRAEPRRRERASIIAGSYHAAPKDLRRDVERALRRLRTDRIDVFLLFWVRSAQRLSDEALEALLRLKSDGQIRTFGFSTHHRELALEAVTARPWEVVMTRHSAAHTGAERALLPALAERGVGAITFSATCYGRMMSPRYGPQPPSAADCYRYSLSQPGVACCLSAPRRYRELRENLEVLARPTLEPAALAALRARGERVYEGNRSFNALVRQGAGSGRDAFLSMLESIDKPFSPDAPDA